MIFDALVVGNIRRSPFGTLLVIFAIAFGVASFVAARLTNAFAERAIEASVSGASAGANLQVFRPNGRLGDAILSRVRDVPGVIEAHPVLESPVELRSAAGVRVAVELVGVDVLQRFPGSRALRREDPGPFAPPGALESDLIERAGVLMPASLAARLAARAGSKIAASANSVTTLTVTAVLPPQTLDLDRNTILVDLVTARKMLGTRDTFDRIDVVAVPARLAEVRRRIVASLPAYVRISLTAERIAKLQRLSQGFERNLTLMAYVSLIVGAALIMNALGLSVAQRRPAIGIFRSLGATRGQIALAFIGEGVSLGVLGGIVGAVVGDVLARTLSSLGAPLASVETATQIANDTALLSGGIVLGALLSLCAAIAPAIEAASVMPANAVRIIPPRGRFEVSWLAPIERALSQHWSVPGRLAFGRFAANRMRSMLAIAALVISICASIGVATAGDSFRATIAQWSDELMPGDLELRPATAGSAALPPLFLRTLARLPGVSRVSQRQRSVKTPPGDPADTIFVFATPGYSPDRLRASILAVAAPLELDVRTSSETRAVETEAFDESFALTSAVGNVSIAVAVLGTLATMMALVDEQRNELRILRILGLSLREMRRMIVYEAMIVSTLGGLLGAALGLLLGVTLVVFVDRRIAESAIPVKLSVLATLGTPLVVVVAAALGAVIASRVVVAQSGPNSLRSYE